MKNIATVIVRVQGGLGNQMFQYALFLWLKEHDRDPLLDISHYDYNYSGNSDAIHNGYELERIFNICGPYASKSESKHIASIENDYIHKILRKIVGIKKTHVKQDNIKSKYIYNPEIMLKKPAYFDGYWCTFRYAEEVKDAILSSFFFSKELKGNNKKVAQEIIRNNSISIHVRHGDYLKLQDYLYVPGIEYYERAVSYIKEKVVDPVFYFFSDDIDWCKRNFKNINAVFVENNIGIDSYIDMQLMSMCKHNIVANSTFSMWGAWLNNNPNKIVIRPHKVYIDQENEKLDMWPNSWITLDTI